MLACLGSSSAAAPAFRLPRNAQNPAKPGRGRIRGVAVQVVDRPETAATAPGLPTRPLPRRAAGFAVRPFRRTWPDRGFRAASPSAGHGRVPSGPELMPLVR